MFQPPDKTVIRLIIMNSFMCSLAYYLAPNEESISSIKAIGNGIVWKYGEHGKSFIQCIIM